MNDKQFNFIMRHLYDELCAAVDNYEFVISNPRVDDYEKTLDVVASADMYERLKYYFSKLIDLPLDNGS